MVNTIFILDEYYKVTKVLTINGQNTFFDDLYSMDLSTGTESYEFSTNIEDIEECNYVMFYFHDQYKLFQIVELEQEHSEGKIITTVYGESACLELLNSAVRPFTGEYNCIAFFQKILEGTHWSIGRYSTSLADKVLSIEIDSTTQVWSCIQDYMTEYGYELNTRVIYENGYVKYFVIDIYAEGELGEKTYKRFEYGRNVEGITKKKDLYEWCTALILDTDKEIVDITYNKDGYVKESGSDVILATNENAKYNLGRDYIYGSYEDNDSPSGQEVVEKGVEELKRRAVPHFDYECDTALTYQEYEEINVGDTVYVIDHSFNPAVTLEARVGELEISFTDRNNCKCNLTNYKEIKSKIDVALTGSVKAIVEAYFPITSDGIADGAITAGKIETTYLQQITSDIVSASTVVAEDLIAKEVTAINGQFDNLSGTYATITDLEANYATIDQLNTTNANVTNLQANKADITYLESNYATIDNLSATNAEINTIKSNYVTTDTLQANYATITNLNSTNAEIDNIKSNYVLTNYLTANYITAGQIQAGYATITDLNAAKGNISILQSDVADINTLLNGNLTSDNIQSLNLTASNTTIANALIKDAMIDSVSANKINTGTINTNNVSITNDDGSILINGATQQFKDSTGTVRVQIGKDANGDFTFALFSQDGIGILLDEDGIHAGAVPDGLIVNDMVANNANISGSKLDINSVISSINNGTTTIKGTRVQLDEEGQSLEVAFNQLKTKVETIEEVSIDGDLSSVIEQVNTNTSNISIAQGQISSLITNTTITKENGETIQLKDAYNSTVSTVNSNTTKIGSLETNLATTNSNLSTVTSKQSTLEQDLNNFKTTVSSTYTTKTDFNNLTIGGRNYLKGTATPVTRVGDNTTNQCGRLYYITVPDDIVGNIITISFTYKVTDYTSGTFLIQTALNAWEGLSGTITPSGNGTFTYTRTMIKNTATGYTYVEARMDNFVGTIEFSNMKLEIGNKATSWTPAPEDIDDSITAVDNKFANYSTTTAMNSAIDQKADSILNSVSSTYTTQTDFNNLQIGSRNYILNSALKNNANNFTLSSGVSRDTTKLTPNGNNSAYISITGLTSFEYRQIRQYIKTLVVGKTYTASAYIYIPSDHGIDDTCRLEVICTDTSNTRTLTASTIADTTILDEWQFLTCTFTVPENSVLYQYDVYISKNGKIYCGDFSIVEGDKGLWLPAPEDTESSITSLTTRMDSAESKLTKDSLTTTIGSYYTTSTDVDGMITAKGYATTSQVSQTASDLTAKFSSSGGYNWLRNGNFANSTTYWGTTYITLDSSRTYNGHNSVKISQSGNTSDVWHGSTQTFATSIPAGKTFTISLWYYVEDKTTFNSDFGLEIKGKKAEATSSTSLCSITKNSSTLVQGAWTRLSITKTTDTTWNDCFAFFWVKQNGTIWVTDIQVEEGSVATLWSPHPYEVYEGITTINKDGIKVSQSNYSGYTHMTVNGFYVNNGTEDVIKCTSDGLYIKGNVTVTGGSMPTSLLSGTISSSQLASSITNDISTAKTNASTALSTANTASTNASSAVSTANTASSNASSALSTANTASTNASNAVNTANSAVSTANTASTNASTALSTANSVKSTLDSNSTNWTNAYNRVKEWAYGAVTGTTNINGGMIQANTIAVNKLAVGDFENYSHLNASTYSQLGFTQVADSSATGNPWYQLNTLTRDTKLNVNESGYTMFKCEGGGTFRIKFQFSSTVTGATTSGGTGGTYMSIRVGLYCKNTAGDSKWYIPVGGVSDSSGTVNTVNTTITLPSDIVSFGVYLQIGGWDPFAGTLKVRNIEVRKMSDGELIVDGSITASKINVTDLSAIGAKIGGFTINDHNIYGTNVGMTSSSGYGYAFWAGADGPANSGSAPFRVGHAGELYASNATIAGTINSSTINASDLRGGTFYTAPDSTATYGYSFRIYSNGDVYSKSTIQVYGTAGDNVYAQLKNGAVTATEYMQTSAYKTTNSAMRWGINGADATSSSDSKEKLEFKTIDSNNYFRPMIDSAVRCGSTSYRWYGMYSTNGVSTSSDRTLKENIRYLDMGQNDYCNKEDMYNFIRNDYALAQFNYIGHTEERVSAIAQDLLVNTDGTDNKIGQLIVNAEEAVELNKEGEDAKLGIDQTQLLNITIGALQEAINKVEELEGRITELENK